ncbi:MAG: hypothetical protein U1D67_04365 [Dehalococcoidia bacterium]|nr:hypothetical protein [Dehalococcoidia bacterium]MDZ4246337.1 hypothetical protein [Dehalococcoidia bacterium]
MSQGWRGTVGLIKPTYRTGSLEHLIRVLPDGIGVIPLYVGIRRGTQGEFTEALKIAEEKVDELASIGGVDLIHIGGAPPFMLLGYDADHKLVERLTKKHGIPVIASTTGLVKAMKELSIKKVICLTYFKKELNTVFAKYLTDAGFQVLAIEGLDRDFKDVGNIPEGDIYSFAKKQFLQVGGADAIHLLGSGWDVYSAIEKLEQDLQTTVISTGQISIWDILRTLKVREPVKGCGKLLSQYL